MTALFRKIYAIRSSRAFYPIAENNNLSSPSRYFDKHRCCSRRRSLNDVQRQIEARKMPQERLSAVKITRLRKQRCEYL